MDQVETLETDGGNTKTPSLRSNQLKKMVFTLNNYVEEDIIEILETLERNCTKYGFQTEVGTCGTPHLQGALWLKKPMRWSELGLKCKPHFEKMLSEKGSNDYVQKSDSFAGRRWMKGLTPVAVAPLSITTLYPWQSRMEEIFLTQSYNEYGTNRNVRWMWEPVGNVGKTAFVRYLCIKYEGSVLFCNGGKASDLLNLIFNADMQKVRAVIWDLPRENEGFVSSTTIESVLNGMVCNTKYETGTKIFNAPHVFIFSNHPPKSEEELSKDRWIIEKL